MIEHLPNLMAGWGVQLAGVLSPGPAVALLLGVGLSEGRTAALTTCFGIALGAMLLASLAIFGLAAILVQYQLLLIAVKMIGAAYLLWLAWGAFKRAASPPPAPSATEAPVPPSTAGRIARGFIFQMGNPKAIFYWIAVAAVAGFETVSLPALAVFLIGAFLISYLGHGAWGVLLSSHPMRTAYQSVRRWIEGALGAFFTFAAFKLATTRIG